ncbi:MAG: hypothetical protein KAX26_06470 [Anaerolineae bacterium]|nr:hypothetical protein [Anaerolineae bacterium]
MRPEVYHASRKVLRSPFVVVEGQLQKRGQAISVPARGAIPLDRGFRLMSACCQTYPWGCSLPCRSERPLSGET